MRLPPPPWVVAHRGASGARLENTVEACRLAVEAGAPMIEIDVQLAADDELVVFHDQDLSRLGNGDRRAVERMTSAELGSVELSLVRDDSPNGEPLRGRAPTLAELLAALPPELPLDVELKRFHANYSWLAGGLAEALADRPNVLISSFDWQALAYVRTLLPHMPVAPIESRRPEAVLDAAVKLSAWSIHVHRRLASADLVTAARAAGRPLLVYTVNDAAEARELFALGVSGVFSDHPARLLRELELTPVPAPST
ncbi:MAG TPA: glycerophosphodiester phosphodiesterase family protein [Thermoanaerobaculia bacterium]|nr:glycerophosphodiester phosphodiesterase family protein [Thermoanaerobaculia bacterium]HXT50424.1 glycerophosphodiester phosphodiesterase family protein [Thermoanaerobaculia bacterium]